MGLNNVENTLLCINVDYLDIPTFIVIGEIFDIIVNID